MMVFPILSPPAVLMPFSIKSFRTMSTVFWLKMKRLRAAEGMNSAPSKSSVKSSSKRSLSSSERSS